MGYYGIGGGGLPGSPTTIDKSTAFSYVAKKDTINGSHEFVGTGYMAKTLNSTKTFFSSVSATYSADDATYCYFDKIDFPLQSCIGLNAEFSAFQMVKYGTPIENSTARFAYSENLRAIVLRDGDGYHVIGSTTSHLIYNDTYTPVCGITVSSGELFLYGGSPGAYDALSGTPAENLVPNMKWSVRYEYTLMSHDTDEQYYT